MNGLSFPNFYSLIIQFLPAFLCIQNLSPLHLLFLQNEMNFYCILGNNTNSFKKLIVNFITYFFQPTILLNMPLYNILHHIFIKSIPYDTFSIFLYIVTIFLIFFTISSVYFTSLFLNFFQHNTIFYILFFYSTFLI